MDLPELETRYPWFTESFSRTASSMVDVVVEAGDFWIPESKGNPLPSSSADAWTGDPTVLLSLSDDWRGYTEDGFSKSRAEFLSLTSRPVPTIYSDPYQVQAISKSLERAGSVLHAGFKIYDLGEGEGIYSNPFLPRVGFGGVALTGASVAPPPSIVISVQLEAMRIYGPDIFNGPASEEVMAFLEERLGMYLIELSNIGMDTVYDANLTPARMVGGIEALNGIGSTIGYPTLGSEVYSFFSTGDTLFLVVKEGYLLIQDIFAGFGASPVWLGIDIYRFGGVPTSIDYEFGEYETRDGVVQVAEVDGAQFIKSFIGIKPDGTNASLYGWVSDSPIDVITFDDMIYAKLGRTRPSRMGSAWYGVGGGLYLTARIYEGTGLDFFNGHSYTRFPGGGFRRGKMGLG